MESWTAVLPVQSCTCPCKHSTTSRYSGKADYAMQRIDSSSFAGSRQELGSLNLKLSRRRLPATTTRCLYSPLVESFEATRSRSFTTTVDGNGRGKILVSTASLSLIKPVGVETRSGQDIVQQESSYENDHFGNEQRSSGDDSSPPAPRDPVAAAHGDSTFRATASDGGHDLEARKTARYRQPQTMSLTHGFRAAAHKGVNSTIGVSGRPIANAGKIGGPAGLLVGLAVAGLGIATAFQKAAEMHPQKLCTRCDGYGVECCDVCSGAGKISWEGKAIRTHACPKCFGSCLNKCPRCDGCRVKKESTSVLQQLKTPPKSSPKK